jgi:hypothetical protein
MVVKAKIPPATALPELLARSDRQSIKIDYSNA